MSVSEHKFYPYSVGHRTRARPYVFFVPEEMKEFVGEEFGDMHEGRMANLQEWFLDQEFEVEPIEGDIIQCVWEDYRNSGTYILINRNGLAVSELAYEPDDYGCVPYPLTCPNKFPVHYFKDVIVHNSYVKLVRELQDQFRDNLTIGHCDKFRYRDREIIRHENLYSWGDYDGRRYWLMVEVETDEDDWIALYDFMYRHDVMEFACDSCFNAGMYALKPNLLFVAISDFYGPNSAYIAERGP